MTDQSHPNSVRVQSTAIVIAALITTLGAVAAACIQTGWLGKPINIVPPTLMSIDGAPQPMQAFLPPSIPASFVGTIEPVDDDQAANLEPAAANMPTKLTTGRAATSNPGAANQGAAVLPRSILTAPEATFRSASYRTPLASNSSPMVASAAVPSTSMSAPNLFPPQANSTLVYYPPTPQANQPQAPARQVSAVFPADAAMKLSADYTTKPTDNTVKPVASPWSYLGSQPVAPPANLPQPVKKSFDWNTVARFFQGHD